MLLHHLHITLLPEERRQFWWTTLNDELEQLKETPRIKATNPLLQIAPFEPSSPPRYTHSPNGPGTYLILDNATKVYLSPAGRQVTSLSTRDSGRANLRQILSD
ncbi:uncharacterized protein ARMOST_14469 [Armillaria ostoyae]|uniref:Uncharacterized protein n=1 Tax=Armillaria ostoyae TaxID=47428 RepID=A0A284RQS1_ARMOS|nr:uncharacterized protein ARMOST_14469 [Armillaria ostoyae]